MTKENILDILTDIRYDVDNNIVEDITLKDETCTAIVDLIDEITMELEKA